MTGFPVVLLFSFLFLFILYISYKHTKGTVPVFESQAVVSDHVIDYDLEFHRHRNTRRYRKSNG